jgi:hypothetical protein
MIELDRNNLGSLKDGNYWVYDETTKKIIFADFSNGFFYYHDIFRPYFLRISRVTFYKKVSKPKK